MNKIAVFFFLMSAFTAYSSEDLKNIIDKYVRYDKWTEASVALKEYTRINAEDPDGYALSGLVNAELGNYDEAILYLKKSITYTSNDEKRGEYYFNIANIQYKQKKNDAALEMLNKSLELNPILPGSHYLKGLIHYDKGEMESVITSWNKYLNYSSDSFKKEKIAAVLSLLSKKIEDERKKREEEERKKQELLDLLKDQLDSKSENTKSLQDYKINKDKNNDEEFELID